jgi:hypothetical protein
MKKTLIVLSLIIALVTLAVPVFAATSWQSGNLSYGANTPLSIATSKNVNLWLELSGTTVPVINYVMATYHGNGTRTFGASNADSKLFFIEATGTAVTVPAVSTAAGVPPTWGAGWNPL